MLNLILTVAGLGLASDLLVAPTLYWGCSNMIVYRKRNWKREQEFYDQTGTRRKGRAWFDSTGKMLEVSRAPGASDDEQDLPYAPLAFLTEDPVRRGYLIDGNPHSSMFEAWNMQVPQYVRWSQMVDELSIVARNVRSSLG